MNVHSQESTFLIQNFAHSVVFDGITNTSRLKNSTRDIINTHQYHEDFTLLNTIQMIFSDYYLYKNQRIRRAIQNNQKHFVPIGDLFNEQILQQYILLSGVDPHNQLEHFLRTKITTTFMRNLINKINDQVKNNSKDLICRNYQIKRKVPFVDKIESGESQPLYIFQMPIINNYQDFMKMVILRLHEMGSIQQIYYTLHKKPYEITAQIIFFTTEKEKFLHRRLSDILGFISKEEQQNYAQEISSCIDYFLFELLERLDVQMTTELYLRNQKIISIYDEKQRECKKEKCFAMKMLMQADPWTQKEKLQKYLFQCQLFLIQKTKKVKKAIKNYLYGEEIQEEEMRSNAEMIIDKYMAQTIGSLFNEDGKKELTEEESPITSLIIEQFKDENLQKMEEENGVNEEFHQ